MSFVADATVARGFRLVAVAVAVLATGSATTTAGAAAAQNRDLSGVWLLRNDQVGFFAFKSPSLTPEGDALLKAREAAARAGNSDDPSMRCTAIGFPRNMVTRFPFQIVQNGEQILELFATSQRTRRIFIDGRPHDAENLDNFGPLYNGYAVGKWEGTVWVVETIGIKETTWIDGSGVPRSPDMKVTERIRRQGNTLTIETAIEDPRMFRRPWKTTKVYDAVSADLIPETNCRTQLAKDRGWASSRR